MHCCGSNNNTIFRVSREKQQLLKADEPSDFESSHINRYHIRKERFHGGCGVCKRSLPFEYQSPVQDSQRFRGGCCEDTTTTMSRQNYKRLGSPKTCPYPKSGPPRRSYPPLPYSIPPPYLTSPSLQKSDRCGQNSKSSEKGCCPCGSCAGPACIDNPGGGEIRGGSKQEPRPCKCKCQSCRKFPPLGGCGGQSCGGIYSCAGPGSGRCCFPRNSRRRTGPECCGGDKENCGGCC